MATSDGALLGGLPPDLRREVASFLPRPDGAAGPSTDELALSAVSTVARADYQARHPQDAARRQAEKARLDAFMTRVRSGGLTLEEVINAIQTANPRIVGAPITPVDQERIRQAVRRGLGAIQDDESAFLAALHQLVAALSRTCAGTARREDMDFARFAGGQYEYDTDDSDDDNEGFHMWNLGDSRSASVAYYREDPEYYGPESAVALNLYTDPPPELPYVRIVYSMRDGAPPWPSLPDTFDHVRRIGQDRPTMFRDYLAAIDDNHPVDLVYNFDADDVVLWAVGAVARCCLFSNDAARGVRLHQGFIDMQA